MTPGHPRSGADAPAGRRRPAGTAEGGTHRPQVLALGPRPTGTGALLAAAARRRGMRVAALPQDIGAAPPGGCHYQGGPLFADQVAGPLELALLDPPGDWPAALPRAFTGRRVRASVLDEARTLTRPAFVKPAGGKEFPARVYPDGRALPGGLPPESPVLIADPVVWVAELRLFLLDGEVRAGGRYASFGRLDAVPLHRDPLGSGALAFAGRLLAEHAVTLPSATVLDVGLMRPDGDAAEQWAVVEANMAWFSGCYAADPDRVLDVVLRSAGPRRELRGGDRRFVRPAAA
ncbi:ATP-grasp domain-containing protein [Nocardiopsis potens]|uniref:ATP-grasp domain-containing protein n=1 Tax=Nocardiopsis potens TaxID=1246458 RepID=UPI000373DF88|nr:ATP-grasp domain-containing protein [Nocardiopsis potens]